MNDLRSTRRSVLRAGFGALLAMPLFRAIGQMAARVPNSVATHQKEDRNQTDTRRRAELLAKHKLLRHPLRRLVFSWVLRNARNRVRDRENLRAEVALER